MSKYRARTCPRCNYYVGFSVVKSLFKSAEACITSFCLNCNYKLPIYAVLRGIRRAASPAKRGTLRLAKNGASLMPSALQRGDPSEPPLSAADYARHLRAVGQELEDLRLTKFNLECAGNSYWVWPRSEIKNADANLFSQLSKNGIQGLWKNKAEPRPRAQREYFSLPHAGTHQRLRYSLHEIDRIEREGQSRRCQKSGVTDGHRLSQLLRTVGALVAQRGERLLGISWDELSVSIVVQTAHGRRELDVFRRDNLYDLWVRMYLRRGSRALSDIPQ